MSAVFPLTMLGIRTAYAMQSLAYMAYRIPRNELVSWAERELLNMEGNGIIFKGRLVFDETVWPPVEKDAHKNICRFDFAMTPGTSYYAMVLDLRKNMREGVSLIDTQGSSPIDLFNVSFVEEITYEYGR